MDYMKRKTACDYTAWDLNVKCVKNDNKMEHKMKRKARRKLKVELKNTI